MSESVDVYLTEKVSKPVDLVDGPHKHFYCSNCNAPLLDIWETQPTSEPVWLVRAECPFCGDHSFVQEINSVHFCPTGLDTGDGPYCGLGDWYPSEKDEQILIFEMVKAREYNE